MGKCAFGLRQLAAAFFFFDLPGDSQVHIPWLALAKRNFAKPWCELTPLESAFPERLVSADSKGVAEMLSALESALTKNGGVGYFSDCTQLID